VQGLYVDNTPLEMRNLLEGNIHADVIQMDLHPYEYLPDSVCLRECRFSNMNQWCQKVIGFLIWQSPCFKFMIFNVGRANFL